MERADAVTPDRVLVQRMQAGDERALAGLYDRHAATAYGLAMAIVREAADAEEAVADAFAQVWRTAGQFDPGRGSVAAWLATITRTRALDLVRARGRRARALDRAALGNPAGVATPLAAVDATDRGVERSEARALVAGALAALPEPQRIVLELGYFGGLSQSQIASELGEPLGTVKTRMRAALEKLRAVLAPQIAEGSR